MDIRVIATGSTGNCYYVSDGKTPLLLEAGVSCRTIQEALGFGLHKVGGCLATHRHKDHCKSLKDLVFRGVDCYMNEDTKQAEFVDGPMVHVLEPGQVVHIGTWRVRPFEAIHDVPCVGLILGSHDTGERLVYLVDSAYSKYRFERITHWVLGCNYDIDLVRENVAAGKVDRAQKQRLIHSHASIDTIKDLLRANDLTDTKEIWLCHLSDRNSDAQQFKAEIQSATGKPVYIAGGDA